MSAQFTQQQWAEIRRASTENLNRVIAELGMPKALLPYQSKAFSVLELATTSVLFIEKSRRVGFTWGLASYAALKAAKAREAGGMDVMYISYSQEMTREFIDDCAMWARAYSLAAMQMDEFLFEDETEDGNKTSIQAFRIRFASGFEIVGLSSAPRTLRGKQGVVIIDEAAFVDSLKELLKAALAFLIWGGQVIVCSTHNGTENEFNVQVQDILAGRSNYRHMRVDFDEALKQGLYQRICFVTGKDWTPEGEAEWREDIINFYGDGADEELFCVPALGSGAWLAAPLIEARMTEDPEMILRLDLPPDFLQRDDLSRALLLSEFMEALEQALDELDKDQLYALGFDFARVADLSVVFVLAIDKLLRRKTVLVLEMRRTPYAEQKSAIHKIVTALPGMVGAAFDATGSGAEVAETIGREFGFADKDGTGGLVHEIKLSQEWYRTEMPPLKAAFEDGIISLPADDEVLADLRLVKVVRGIPKVPDVRTGEKSKKRHGDAAVALALAYFASRMQAFAFGYRAVTQSEGQPASNRFDTPPADDTHQDNYRPPLGARIRGGGI